MNNQCRVIGRECEPGGPALLKNPLGATITRSREVPSFDSVCVDALL